MKITLLASLLLTTQFLFAQKDYKAIMAEIKTWQQELNAEFADPEETPLTKEDFDHFKGLPFYAIDTTFYVVATFELIKDSQPFEMKTTTSRKPVYVAYARATFVINGQQHQLTIYQSQSLKTKEGYEDYLFLPFTDLSGGAESYPGGRFIDLRIPSGDTIIIDFNKSYNPLCAYNAKYSCPIPPAENALEIAVTAGVKYH